MARTKQRSRPFTILDGMILIAATALGTAWTQNLWVVLKPGVMSLDGSPARNWQRVAESSALVLPLLIFWTIGTVVLGSRKPRPPWGKVARQPGMTACLAAVFILAVSLVLGLILIVSAAKAGHLSKEFWKNIPGSLAELIVFIPPFAGLAVVVAWVMLLLQRQWKSQAGWIDRMGQVLGFLWIVAMVILDCFWVRLWF